MTSRVQDRRRFHPDGTPRDDDLPTDPAVPIEEEAAPAAPAEDGEVAQLRADLETARRRVDELARGIQDGEGTATTQAQVNRGRAAPRGGEDSGAGPHQTVDELDHLSLQSADDSPSPRVRLIRDMLQLLQRLAWAPAVSSLHDPNLAEAVDVELVSSPEQNGIVLEEQRAAYALRGRVIRPGRVKVGKYVTPAKA
jgi:molecular chaperone GrpE (heat shock protein)